MDLIEWQKLNRWPVYSMAYKLGITPNMLSLVRRKHKVPSMLLAKAIVRFTNNEVTLEDLGVKDRQEIG